MFAVKEKTTAKFSGVLKDFDGNAISVSVLNTLTLTLYVLKDGTIINNRNQQNVLNLNNVTVDGSGNLVWEMQPADNAINDATLNEEVHRALFERSWNSGTRFGKQEVDFVVGNLGKVSQANRVLTTSSVNHILTDMGAILKDEVADRQAYDGKYVPVKGPTASAEANPPRPIPNLDQYTGGSGREFGPAPAGPARNGPTPS